MNFVSSLHDNVNLSYLTNLDSVNISMLQLENNNISDLTFLTESNKLFASLYLSGNKIKDLTPLTDLTGVVHLYLSDNCIDDYTPIFDINYLNDVDLSDNYLSDSEDEIESLLNSDSDHPIFVYKPFKDDFVEIENIKLNDFSVKRTDVDYIPKPIISPANATFANNTNLSVNENDIVTVNRYTGQINYNPEYQFDSTNTVFNTNINYSNNGISGTAQLNLLMPVIEELNYEKYIYDTGTTQNYITMSTTTDTTAVKVVQTNTESGAVIGTPIEKNIINDCDYTDYGDNRIVTFSYNENISPDSTVIVYAGDSLGYFSSETINNTNTIEISIEGTNISNISGSSKFLNIINDFNTTGIESNAIGMLCDIENIYFSENIYILAENAFNGSNVKNAIFYSLEPFETEEGVFGTCNDNLTVYPCYDEPSLTYECEQAGITCITNFEFDGHTLTKYYGNSSSVTIPECLKITTIGPNAFKSNYYLKTIDLGEAIYAINDSAFFDCKKLQNVINSENIKRIGNNAFSKSTITDIDISGAEVISSSAFLNCKNITNIVLLGNTETNTFILNDSAFKNCTELKTISYKGTLELGSEVFMGCSKLTDVFSEDVKLTEGTSGGAAFSGCSALTTITLSEDSNIPDESFDGCISLTNVKVKNTETLTIGENAFRGTTALSELGLLAKEIYFETNSLGNEATDLIIYCNADAIKSLSPSVGSVCTDFKTVIWNNKVILEDYLGNSENVVIPDCLEIYQIGSKVFYLKDFLKTIDLPKTLEIIGKQAFSMSFNLEVVSGGEHVKYLGESAFYNDKKLFDIQSLQSLQYLEYASLAYTNISNYRMPQTVYYCNQMVFLGCSALKEIVLSGNLYGLSSGMFYNCSSLERCIIKYGTKQYGQQIFDGCEKLTHIYIPDSAELIQENSFIDTINLYSSPNLPNNDFPISNTIYPNYFVVDGTLLAYNSETGYDYLDTATGERIIKIPNAVERIAPGVFEGKQNIDKIIFYDNYLKVIDNYAFKNCSVYEVVLPTSITCIGVGAFEGTNLTNIDIPNSITKIESYCFNNTPLSSITIPRSVTEIDNNAFSNCEQLESLFIHDDVTTIGDNVFENCTNLTIKAYINSTPLVYAQNHNIPYEIMYRLNPLEGSSTVFNRNAGYVYGLKTSLIKTYFQNRCTQLDEGYTLAYEMTHVRYMGTDTVVKVMKGDTVVETYKILIFGDLNGDSQINIRDISIISDIIAGNYELEEGSLVEIAADVYQHGSGITVEDKELLYDVYWGSISLPQNPYATI